MFKWIISVFAVASFTGCGGGGGGGGTSTTSSSPVSCVSSQVSGCSYSASDQPQSAEGWWKGTRTVDTGTTNVYLTVSPVNAFVMYIADDFSGGAMSGTVNVIGSTLSSVSGIGNDKVAGFFPLGSTSVNGGSGGVVTKQILSYTSGINYSLSRVFSMSYTYNAIGDEPISQNVGTYAITNGYNNGSSLTVNSNGTLTATYIRSIFVPTQGYVDTPCSVSKTFLTTTKLKDVVISGTDTCSQATSIKVYAYANSLNNRIWMFI